MIDAQLSGRAVEFGNPEGLLEISRGQRPRYQCHVFLRPGGALECSSFFEIAASKLKKCKGENKSK